MNQLLTLVCVGLIAVCLFGFGAAELAAQTDPDLYVSYNGVRPIVDYNSNTTAVSVEIRNGGAGAAGVSFVRVRLEKDAGDGVTESTYDDVECPAIPPGGVVWVTTTALPGTDWEVFSACADYSSLVTESDETNNTTSTSSVFFELGEGSTDFNIVVSNPGPTSINVNLSHSPVDGWNVGFSQNPVTVQAESGEIVIVTLTPTRSEKIYRQFYIYGDVNGDGEADMKWNASYRITAVSALSPSMLLLLLAVLVAAGVTIIARRRFAGN